MLPLAGAVQHYAWGSSSAIPNALGLEPDGRPWAELWWGTHPSGPTHVTTPGGDRILLSDLAGPLPFLVKLLAAAHPLSLQAHPTEQQAEVGFAREERAGVPLGSPRRLYRDRLGKPEVLVAVTPFQARCGFRPLDEAAAELHDRGGATIADALRREGPARTVAWLLTERPDVQIDHPLVSMLSTAYPGDPGAIVALLLNPVDLAPGEAVFLAPGQLHMYLHGVGVEVMGASDNVLRGGLTPKHVDVPELLSILDPEPTVVSIRRPGPNGWYDLPTDVFAVQAIGPGETWTAHPGGEVVVRLDGGGNTEAFWVDPGARITWPHGLGLRVARAEHGRG